MNVALFRHVLRQYGLRGRGLTEAVTRQRGSDNHANGHESQLRCRSTHRYVAAHVDRIYRPRTTQEQSVRLPMYEPTSALVCACIIRVAEREPVLLSV